MAARRRERLLVIGHGMAAARLVDALDRLDPGAFAVTIVGAEPVPAYNRVLLSALLAGEASHDDIALRDVAWHEARGMSLIMGDPVVAVDASHRTARLASGLAIGFDRCVFATGSEPVRLPLPGMDLPGVMTFRDLADVAAMERAAAEGQRVAVIGGGLLGIEAAHGLARRGAKVTLVHVMDRLMERQLDAGAARVLKRELERKGVAVALGRQSIAVTGTDRATGLAFADGGSLSADVVVAAVGIRPNAALAKDAGLAVARGILIDDAMQASLPGFHAIGECAEHRGVAYGLVEPAYAQADALARRLCGGEGRFEGLVLATNLKVSGVPVFSAGAIEGDADAEIVTLDDRAGGVYRKLVIKAGKLIGCVLVGEAEDSLWYLDLIRRAVDIGPVRGELVHGRAYCGALETPAPEAAAALQVAA